MRYWRAGTRPLSRTRVGQWAARGPRQYLMVAGGLILSLDYLPHYGYAVAAYRRIGVSGRTTELTPTVELEGHMQRRQVKVAETPDIPSVASQSKVFQRFPSIVAHCCVTWYEDKTPRKPGWITIRTRGQRWEVIAKDPDAAASLMASGVQIDDALVLLEQLLSSQDAGWEHDPYLAASKPKNRKK